MKPIPVILLIAFASAPVLADVPTVQFDRYQVILERKPFGELVAPIAAPVVIPPEPQIPKTYRLCSIIKQDNGTITVGIIDLRSQKGLNLIPGGPADGGLKVNAANYEEGTAELQLGEEIQQLTLSGSSTPVSPGGGTRVITTASAAAPPMPTPQNYADRRRQRFLETQEPVAAPQPKYTGEELQKHLQNYQLEVIRNGLPPLPIPLTKEQDDQLVKEGILPVAQ